MIEFKTKFEKIENTDDHFQARVMVTDMISPYSDVFYSHDIVEDAVKAFQEKIMSSHSIGMLEKAPDNGTIDLEKISHIILKLEFRNSNELWTEIKIVDTPCGKQLSEMHKANINFYPLLSSLADVKNHIVEGMEIISISVTLENELNNEGKNINDIHN